MEEKEKSELINNLYALRAGLSVISQEKDKIVEQKKLTKNMYRQLANEFLDGREKYVFFHPYHLASADCQNDGYAWYDENHEPHNTSSSNIKTECSLAKWFYHNTSYTYIYDPTAIISKSLWFPNSEKNKVQTEERFVTWLTTEEGEIFITRKLNLEKQYKLYEPKKTIFKKKQEIAKAEADRLHHQQRLEIYQAMIDDLKQLQQNYKEWKQLSANVASTAKTVSTQIEQTFQQISPLDPRDWKYLDLVIFYLETGRADTMKEALQLVEREVQTQRIVGAIQEASDRICRTIARAAAVISSQLNTISLQLSQSIALQQQQIAQNERLIGAANMQNALLAKANATSEQLMNDVSFIKNYGVKSVGR